MSQMIFGFLLIALCCLIMQCHCAPQVREYEEFFDDSWHNDIMAALHRHYNQRLSDSDRNLFKQLHPIMELVQSKVITDRQECTNQITKQSNRLKKLANNEDSVFGDVVQSFCRMRGDCMPVLSKAMLQFLNENRMIRNQLDVYLQSLGISSETMLTFFPYTFVELCKEIRAIKL